MDKTKDDFALVVRTFVTDEGGIDSCCSCLCGVDDRRSFQYEEILWLLVVGVVCDDSSRSFLPRVWDVAICGGETSGPTPASLGASLVVDP